MRKTLSSMAAATVIALASSGTTAASGTRHMALPSGETWVCYFSPDSPAIKYRFATSVTQYYKDITYAARQKWNERATNVKFAGTGDVSERMLSVHEVNQPLTGYLAWVAYTADLNDIGDCGSNPHLWLNSKVGVWYNTPQMGGLTTSEKEIVAAHELGHSLGLGHPPGNNPADPANTCSPSNPRPSIMYTGSPKFTYCTIPRSRDVINVNNLYW